jgi:hypothetical protein
MADLERGPQRSGQDSNGFWLSYYYGQKHGDVGAYENRDKAARALLNYIGEAGILAADEVLRARKQLLLSEPLEKIEVFDRRIFKRAKPGDHFQYLLHSKEPLTGQQLNAVRTVLGDEAPHTSWGRIVIGSVDVCKIMPLANLPFVERIEVSSLLSPPPPAPARDHAGS